MRVLNARTGIPETTFARRHTPRAGTYQSYRSCLGWDFGFYCCACWLHESDHDPYGLGRSGQMWVEHYEPRSVNKERKHDYTNCLYSCRFCNQHRKALPIRAPDGAQLLQPCEDIWSEHFAVEGHSLRPLTPSAQYTERAYDINDYRKLELRRQRAETIPEMLEVLSAVMEDIAVLMGDIDDDSKDRAAKLQQLGKFLRIQKAAWRTLERYRAVPRYAENQLCRCEDRPSLPEFAIRASTEIIDVGVT